MKTEELEISENQIFQAFDLNLAAMRKITVEEVRKIYPNARKTLREKLEKMGYAVLEAQDLKYGIPESIILVAEAPPVKDFKGDFYGITSKLGLQFKSGHCYLKTP